MYWSCLHARSAELPAILILAVALAASPATIMAQAASPTPIVAQDTSEPSPDQRTPRGAMWRAAAVPGWGQIYNRQYYKLPFVYAGLGAMVGLAIHNNSQYLTYRRAYLFAREPETWPQYAEEAAPFADLIAAGREELLRRQRDLLRRNRDLSYIGIGLFYGLTMLDAYVSAHLMDFDIDEDLSLRIVPVPETGLALHLSWRLN